MIAKLMSMYCKIKQGPNTNPTNNGRKNKERTAAKATGWHRHSIGTKYLAWIKLLLQHENSLAHMEDHLCFLCLFFSSFHVCSLLPCSHLLGKRWHLGSCWWCLLYFCYFPMWYPGSGVVLDCIVSSSLLSFLLSNLCTTSSQNNETIYSN